MKIPLLHTAPREIYTIMKKSVIGQDEALKTVATALSAHIARVIHNQLPYTGNPIKKDNLIVMGPSGTGKTESIHTAIRELDLLFPVAIAPVNTLSNAGYKGRNVEDIIWDLINDARRILDEDGVRIFSSSDYTIEEKPNGTKVRKIEKETAANAVTMLVENGILILDEFDKIRFSPENPYEGTYKRNLQYELLKIVEGTKGLSENPTVQKIDTTNILVICMGAFTDLLEPPPEPAAIGFSVNKGNRESKNKAIAGIPTTEEICGFGFVPELIGRLPLKCRYQALSAKNLYRILSESEISPVRDFKLLFSQTGNDLQITNAGMREIAKRAHEKGTGARALRDVLGTILYPILYEIDGVVRQHQIVIDKNVVNGEKPVIKPAPWVDVIDDDFSRKINAMTANLHKKEGQP